MRRLWRTAVLRVLSAVLALAMVAGPGWMPAMAGMPVARGMAHAGHSPAHHQHPRHPQTDCCDSCATHCAGQQSIVEPDVIQVMVAATGRRANLDRRRRQAARNPQLRLPPSQAPPVSLD